MKEYIRYFTSTVEMVAAWRVSEWQLSSWQVESVGARGGSAYNLSMVSDMLEWQYQDGLHFIKTSFRWFKKSFVAPNCGRLKLHVMPIMNYNPKDSKHIYRCILQLVQDYSEVSLASNSSNVCNIYVCRKLPIESFSLKQLSPARP
jgi:hypothetical protein